MIVSYHASREGAVEKAIELGLLKDGEGLEQDLFSDTLTNQGGLIIEPVELCGQVGNKYFLDPSLLGP